ncbi:MAG: 50S ribosomal protein L21 [Spirochaetaceae bacterium]|nr:50S ribosomal protein L21 [Spirochaetaceae bacterium]
MYALVEILGKQYKAEKDSILKIDKVDAENGSFLEFDSVLLLNNDGKVKVGTPYVKGVKVSTTVEDHRKGKKVTIIKFKKRKGYRRKQGHRQNYTFVKVNEIAGV